MQKASQEFEVVRSWKTLRDMLRDRGCDTSDIDAISGEDVASIATSKSVFHIDLVGCNTRIIYDLNSKFKPIDVKKLLVDDIPTIVLIARDAPSNAAIKGFAEMSLHVQLFLLQELQFNVSKHVLVPSHTPIRDEPDILRLVNSYHVKSRYHFPIILSSDPMARYLALMPGQLVRITRTSPNAGEIIDNIGISRLIDAFPQTAIVPLFALDPAQADPGVNTFFSQKAFDFMLDALRHLKRDYVNELHVINGDHLQALDSVARHARVLAVGINADVTPFAKRRQSGIQAWCSQHDARFMLETSDHNLVDPSTMPKPYKRFSPFYIKYNTGAIAAPTAAAVSPTFRRLTSLDDVLPTGAGGPSARDAALGVLNDIRAGKFASYETDRHFPSKAHGTTQLSTCLKFGCISVREVYHAVVHAHDRHHGLVRSLFWRAFYDQLTFHFPHTISSRAEETRSFRTINIPWRAPRGPLWRAWCTGRTGVPFVDAGMRQLLTTGRMHNRLRMVTASFLVKDLRIYWGDGELFFARHLEDYSPSANNGGWQWVSGSGADANHASRVLSPWLQARRFDPDATFIKTFVPELAALDASDILRWDVTHHRLSKQTGYPAPCVDHAAAYRELMAFLFPKTK